MEIAEAHFGDHYAVTQARAAILAAAAEERKEVIAELRAAVQNRRNWADPLSGQYVSSRALLAKLDELEKRA